MKSLSLPSGMCYLVPGGTPKALHLSDQTQVLVMTRQRKTADSYPNFNKSHTVPHLTHHNGNAEEPLDEPDQLLYKCPTCGAIAFKQEFTLTEFCQQQTTTSTHNSEQRARWHAHTIAFGVVPFPARSFFLQSLKPPR